MTYDSGRIEIASDGLVSTGGLVVGTIAFNSLADRMRATGEHYTEDAGPDYESELQSAVDEAEAATSRANGLAERIEKVIDAIADGTATLKSIEADLGDIL